MKLKISCLLLLGVISACNGDFWNPVEKQARKYAQEASSKLYTYYEKLTSDLFELGHVDFDASMQDLETVLKTAKELSSVAKGARQFDFQGFADDELKYIFEILSNSAGDAILDEVNYKKLLKSKSMLEQLASDEDIPAYRNKRRKLAYYPDIEEIFAKSDDPEELKYYWSAWREKNSAWASGHFLRLLEQMRQAALLTQTSNLKYWMKGYNVTEMEDVMKKIQPLYLQLHGFIRKQLHKKYGDLVVDPNGPIPDHLFQQVLAQAWTNGSVFEEMFPHKDLPPYDSILSRNSQYDTERLYEIADDFFTSMGFNQIPQQTWEARVKMNENDDEGDCKASIFDKSPSFYLGFCQKVDFRKFLQAHGYMARIYYAVEKNALPAYYFNSYDLEYAVGEAAILSASTPKYLESISMVNDFEFTEDMSMNRLLRMGVHTLLNIPVYFVHTKMMSDYFEGKVDKTGLNRHYWKLMEKYAGVAPPADRLADSYDFSFKFYIDLTENNQARKFQTEVLGYQFYRKLCTITQEYPNEPLHNCDFSQKRSAGAALKRMMKLGSSEPFRDVMSIMFPENPTVSADSLLEYYKPIKPWLIRQNRVENVIVGWKHHNKTVGSVVVYLDEDEDEDDVNNDN